MNTDTMKVTKKRFRIIIVAIIAFILLAGIAFQWGKSSSAPTTSVLFTGEGGVYYMTPEDAEATRKLLDNRDRYQHWLKSKWSCHGVDYSIYFDHMSFGLAHINDTDPKNAHVLYYTVNDDGKADYVTSYYYAASGDEGSGDVAFFRNLIQEYCGKDENSKKVSVCTDPETLILGGSAGVYPMTGEDAEAFNRLLKRKEEWNPHLSDDIFPYTSYDVCINDEMYSFPAVKVDDEIHYRDIRPTTIDHYRLSADDPEYLGTYDVDEESMKEMWALLEKYNKLNS